MLELICKIPTCVGWVLVGAFGILCLLSAIFLARALVLAIKMWRNEEEFWRVHHGE